VRNLNQLHPLSTAAFLADRPFRARAPWWGADLQTLRNSFTRDPQILKSFAFEDIRVETFWFQAANGRDWLSGRLHQPVHPGGKPLVILLHGLTGSMDGRTIQTSAAHLLGLGYPVLRLNLRGAGETASRCASQYHTGLTADQAAVIAQLPQAATAHGVVLFGYSLGANTALKAASEGVGAGVLRAVVAVCPPIDPAAAVRALERPRNVIYHRHLLRGMKASALACALEPAVAEHVRAATSIYDYDNRITAPLHGYGDAARFYAAVGSGPRLGDIQVPALVIHSDDDPWIPVASYETIFWTSLRNVNLVLTNGGGHCGFHGAGSVMPWHDGVAGRFLEQALAS
jgi:uncharacterized protein